MTQTFRSLAKMGAIALAILWGACGGDVVDATRVGGGDSESHFLKRCSSGGCPEGLECRCGLCTRACSAGGDCAGLHADAVCSDVPACPGTRSCQLPCASAASCAGPGAELGCDDGWCTASTGPTESAGPAEFFRACGERSDDRACHGQLECMDRSCTQRCESDEDCSLSGAICAGTGRSASGSRCWVLCDGDEDCAALGADARCSSAYGGHCVHALTGLCADVLEPTGRFACLPQVLEGLASAKAEALARERECIPLEEGVLRGISYRACVASCDGGEAGCLVTNLALGSGTASGEAEVSLQMEVEVELPDSEGSGRCQMLARARLAATTPDGVYYVSPGVWTGDEDDSPRGDPGPLPSPAGIDVAVREGLYLPTVVQEGWRIEALDELVVERIEGDPACDEIAADVGLTLRADVRQVAARMVTNVAGGVDYPWSDCQPCGREGCELVCPRPDL